MGWTDSFAFVVVSLYCIVSTTASAPHISSNHDTASSLWDESWGATEEAPCPDFGFEELEDLPVEDEEESASAPSGSSSSKPTAAKTTTTKPKAAKTTPMSIGGDEPWNQEDEWWKDPLSMFDEDEEFVSDDTAEEEEEAEQEEEDEQSTEEEVEEDSVAVAKAAAIEKAAIEKAAMEKAAKEKATKEKAEKEKTVTLQKENDKKSPPSPPLNAESKSTQTVGFRKPGRAFLNKKGQQKIITPTNKISPAADKTSKRSSSGDDATSNIPASNASLLAASLPSLGVALSKGSLLASSVPTLGVLATMFVGKVIYEKIIRFRRRKSQEDSTFDLLTADEDEEYNNVLMEQTAQYKTDDIIYSDLDFDDESESGSETGLDVDSDIDSSVSVHRQQQNHQSQQQQRDGKDVLGGSSNNSPTFLTGLRSVLVGGSVPAGGGNGGGGLLSRKVKVTEDELEFLRLEAEKAVAERLKVEQEYEKTSFQLQEAQSEVSQLASTTKYLKSQLKDYEEMMDRTIRNERRKSKAEIQRVKEIMEATREEEREAMRRQFLKELEKMQERYEAERAEREGLKHDGGQSNNSNNPSQQEGPNQGNKSGFWKS